MASDADHTVWSDPGAHAAALRVLPGEPVALADALTPPGTLDDARALAHAFGWALPGDTVASVAAGALHERPTRPSHP